MGFIKSHSALGVGIAVLGIGQRAPGEFHEFWRPFVDSKKAAVVVLGSPMFVRLNTHYTTCNMSAQHALSLNGQGQGGRAA